jgi:hypothetical protein
VDQAADGSGTRSQRGRDLIVRAAFEGARDECLSLRRTKCRHRGKHSVEFVALEHDFGRRARRSDRALFNRLMKASVPLGVQRPIAHDRVEPGLQVNLGIAASQ